MRIIARRTLREFYEDPRYRDSGEPLKAWFREVAGAIWSTPQDIKSLYRSASFLKDNKVVFNIAGNKYRLVVSINYDVGIVYIKFIGTHKAYDMVNMEEL